MVARSPGRFAAIALLPLATPSQATPLVACPADTAARVPALALPRAAALHAQSNLRQGPGLEYAILDRTAEAVPVRITGECLLWRRLRTKDGRDGWAHAALLRPAMS